MMSLLKKDKIDWAKAKIQCMHYVSAQSQTHASDMNYICFEEEGPDGKQRPEVIKKLAAVALAFGVARFISETESDRPFLKDLVEDIIMGKSTGDGPFTTQEYREIAQILEAKDFDNLFSNESGEIH